MSEGAKKFGGAKMLDFRQITLFCFGYRLFKHKMIICFENFGAAIAPEAPWLRCLLGLAFIYQALPAWLVVYVQKSDFHLINMFCVVIVVKKCTMSRPVSLLSFCTA